ETDDDIGVELKAETETGPGFEGVTETLASDPPPSPTKTDMVGGNPLPAYHGNAPIEVTPEQLFERLADALGVSWDQPDAQEQSVQEEKKKAEAEAQKSARPLPSHPEWERLELPPIEVTPQDLFTRLTEAMGEIPWSSRPSHAPSVGPFSSKTAEPAAAKTEASDAKAPSSAAKSRPESDSISTPTASTRQTDKATSGEKGSTHRSRTSRSILTTSRRKASRRSTPKRRTLVRRKSMKSYR
ncbi:MAG: hypothetical protein HQL50_12870, partial [Magnetococcales bacterium]|nr:hypothetical protein [Magnetococcales bacterium]